MSTFEQAKKRIEADMRNHPFHSPESWSCIMLDATKDLTDPIEQEKFWNYLANPTEQRYVPGIEKFEKLEHKIIDHRTKMEFAKECDEKECDEKENTEVDSFDITTERNGFITKITQLKI